MGLGYFNVREWLEESQSFRTCSPRQEIGFDNTKNVGFKDNGVGRRLILELQRKQVTLP